MSVAYKNSQLLRRLEFSVFSAADFSLLSPSDPQAALPWCSCNMAIQAYSPKPKVLIPEKVSPDGLALLKDRFEVDEKKGLSAEELKAIVGDYEALIVRSETKVTAELLDAAKKLKVVARAGVGVDNVDVKAATSLGIIVVNSPSGNINAAAEHTIARKFSACWVNQLLSFDSYDGRGPQCGGCVLEHQVWEMGTWQARWGGSKRKDACYRWSGKG